jgi:hypothetical protein
MSKYREESWAYAGEHIRNNKVYHFFIPVIEEGLEHERLQTYGKCRQFSSLVIGGVYKVTVCDESVKSGGEQAPSFTGLWEDADQIALWVASDKATKIDVRRKKEVAKLRKAGDENFKEACAPLRKIWQGLGWEGKRAFELMVLDALRK